MGRCIASPAFILRPAPDMLSAPDTSRSWRVLRTLGMEFPPIELRPHPRRAGCLLLQALSNSVTPGTHNKLQFLLLEALGYSPKSRCSNSSRHPMLSQHVNESRRSTFSRKKLLPVLRPHPSWSGGYTWAQAI